ncbi:procathepsin L-like [Calliphora vicina]|uniref:procathepsin L-like n=1 Tax=Calliphora vicina TaxID=7373 RepID=UPI00325A5A50
MKLIVCILPLFCGMALAQFGGFVGFGDTIADTFQSGINAIADQVKDVPLLDNVNNFADFAQQAGKTYASAAEQTLREGVFNANKKLVDANNLAYAAGEATFELAINAFADVTNAEFLKNFLGNRKSSAGENFAKQYRRKAAVQNKVVPDAFDWREKGGVTPVKFQGECGSCWSFAVTGAIEGHVFRKTGKLIDLSEQNLVDCGKKEYGLDGCDGGFQEYAFEFVTTQKGIANGEKYPYVANKKTCSYKDNLKAAGITGFAVIEPKDEETMKKVIATLGPLACSINGPQSLKLYDKGIFNDKECNKGEPNHSILVVGYGSENGQDYWIVKNSWSQVWGEDGYFRLPRGKNYCFIASECSYPIV